MRSVAEFTELPLESMEHGLAKPIARIRSEPKQLSKKLGIQFFRSRDDLDDLDAALISTKSGKQFALIRHHHQPLPGTDILTNERSNDLTADLIQSMKSLRISRHDLTWVHPNINRFKIWFFLGIENDFVTTAMYLLSRTWHKQPSGRRDFEVFLSSASDVSEEDKELIERFLEIIRHEKQASTSLLQRRLRLSYTHAARIVDILERRGILGPAEGGKSREILVDLDAKSYH